MLEADGPIAFKGIEVVVPWRARLHVHWLQTLDAGAPVSPFMMGRELGHGGEALVRKVLVAPGRG